MAHSLGFGTNEDTSLQLRSADYPGPVPVEISVQSLHAQLSTLEDLASRSTSADPTTRNPTLPTQP